MSDLVSVGGVDADVPAGVPLLLWVVLLTAAVSIGSVPSPGLSPCVTGGVIADRHRRRDLTALLLRAGWRIPYEPSAVAWTEAPQTVRDVVRQRRRWSFGTIHVVSKHAHAIFEPTAGPLGIVGLPWMMVTQVVKPVLGPFADIWLLLQILSGNWNVAVSVVVLAVVADVVISVVALAADRERPALLLATPLLRVLWRPLQLLIAVRSAVRWTVGGDETWNKVSRYDSVDLEQRQPKTEQLTA